jgi:nicotinate-nucleotide adenylyltransferase
MSASRVTKRVGVFGGTFDPIHNGHLAVAKAAQEALSLDEVLFVVTADQWLREDPIVAGLADRFKMVEVAVGSRAGFTASDVDIVREGSTFTVDTLADLRRQFDPMVELYLIVGADSALSMDGWRNGGEITTLARIVVVGRPGSSFDVGSLDESHPASGAEYVEGPMADVSATRVRGSLSAGRQVGDFVDPAVAEYIEKQGLYR